MSFSIFKVVKKLKKNCVIFLGMFSNVKRISSQSKKLSIISFQNHDTLFFIFNYMHDKYINKIVRLTRQIRFMCETNVGHFCARSIDWIQFSVYFHFSLIFQLILVHSNRHLRWRTITTAKNVAKTSNASDRVLFSVDCSKYVRMNSANLTEGMQN